MKVLYILHRTTTTDGASKALLNMLYGVMQYGVQPIVVCPNKDGLFQTFRENNIPVYPCFYRTGTYPPFDKHWKNRLLFIPRFFGRLLANTIGTLQVCKIYKKEHPALIHTNVSVTNIGYQASRLLHIPHIWHIREYGALDFNYYYYYYSRGQQLHKYQRPNSYTICITKDIRHYNRLENATTSRVIYDGVLSAKSIHYTPTKQPYFLFVGRIEKAKGLIPLLAAYTHYIKQCTHPLPLHIAGKTSHDSYQQECNDIIQKNHIENFVTFLGERKDILALYQEAQALIVPSLSEGFGFITAEAMFSGCLVVGHDIAGTKEQFDNGKQLTGKEIGLRYTTQEQLVQHLLDITTATHNGTFTEQYEPMILRGQQVVKQLYTTEHNAEQIIRFYHQILEQ